ncbi:YfcZ/YiiS family protein [Vibrio sp. SCSIO 43135]|uniref:YfcZ/YiiS family protein n=1 Tax=Vibrio paucivorans TaxID=2829489 RepID=A0A9X3HTJ4_9VIBR|nr:MULTISPECIES: YfcZ/YiiS family protein [Vibrio]MCW8335698.1 YfcZ/YiiS family protein [Vibrio paucivorans]USD43918.1 YfcZ/YiiS family protein [Vibrio sp. SCSIO 43135]
MSIEQTEAEVCEACGCAGEMGFIIKEGDDVAEVTIFANNKEQLDGEFQKYLTLAQQVCANVEHELSPVSDESKELTARFKFEVSAEKLIFELKSRSISR